MFRVLRGDLGARMGYLVGLEVFGVLRMLGGYLGAFVGVRGGI